MAKKNIGENFFPAALAMLINFAVLAKGAHDIWAATILYLSCLCLFCSLVVWTAVVKDHKGLRWDFLWFLVVLLVVFGVSVFGSVNPGESLLEILDWTAAILLFFVALNSLSSKESYSLFLGLILPVILFEFGLVVYQKIIQGPSYYLTDDAPGTLVNASVGSAFVLAFVPLFFDRVRKHRGENRIKSAYWTVGLACCVLLLALFSSLWGFLCLFFCFPLFWGRKAIQQMVRQKPRLAIGIVVFGVALIGFAIWVKTAGVNYFGHPSHPYVVSPRTTWWQSAWLMWQDHPWFGVGLGNFPSAYLAYKVGDTQNTLYAHGLLFMLLSETGIFGLTAALVFLSGFFLRISRFDPQQERSEVVTAVVLYLLYSSIGVCFEFAVNLAVLFILMGAALAVYPGVFKRPKKMTVIPVVACSLLSLPHLISIFVSSQHLVDGRDQLVHSNLDQAMKHFNISAELNPLQYEPHQGLAKAYAMKFKGTGNQSDLEQAIVHQSEAIQRNKLNAALWWEMGQHLQSSHRDSEAREAFAKAMRYHSTSPHTKALLTPP